MPDTFTAQVKMGSPKMSSGGGKGVLTEFPQDLKSTYPPKTKQGRTDLGTLVRRRAGSDS